MQLFKSITLSQHESNLASFFPQGDAFDSARVPTSQLGKFISGLAVELQRAYDAMNNTSEDYDLLFTDELLSQWESAVGIPDNIFTNTGSKAQRRLNVLIKFAKMNVQTASQMQELAVALGFTNATVQPLQNQAFPPYSVPFIPIGAPNSRYIIKVIATGATTGYPPYSVPFIPVSSSTTLLQLLFDIIKPANTKVIFLNS